MKKVAIVTTGHPSTDERIYFKIANSLVKFGYEVSIICSTEKIISTQGDIKIYGFNQRIFNKFSLRRIQSFNDLLRAVEPEIIHACEPMAVWIGFFYKVFHPTGRKVKIIYDVTEWYPENIVLSSKGIKKYFQKFIGHIFNFLAANFSNVLIIGEKYKEKRYKLFSPRKKRFIVGYFPILKHYKSFPIKPIQNEIIFGYAGVISISRGLNIFLEVLSKLKSIKPELEVKFILCGRFENENEKNLLEEFRLNGVEIKFNDWTDYLSFQKYLEPAHICLDTRPSNGIYERSLPIKIFDYMALGKCIVASNYPPIRETFEIAKCGVLVNPNNPEQIVEVILNLIGNPETIIEFGLNARKAAESYFNWEKCEIELLKAYDSLDFK